MAQQILRYEADGATFHSSLYLPDGDGPAPGIVVFPDILGLGDHARERAARLASLGYVALAADYHGEGRILPFDAAMGRLQEFLNDVDATRARARASLDALAEQPRVDRERIGAMGYCYGGTLALELARGGAPLMAVVGFHSGMETKRPEDARNIRGKVLACTGADDPIVPPQQRAAFEVEMRAAKVDWQLHLYGGVVHLFTDPRADALGTPESLRYDAKADARSWDAMLGLFRETLM